MTHAIAAADKALLRRFYKEVYVDWDMDLIVEFLSSQFTSHDWPEGFPAGPQGFRNYYSAIRSALPDARYEVDGAINVGFTVVGCQGSKLKWALGRR